GVMLCQHWNDDRRIFRALALVDGHGVGRHQGVQLAEAVDYGTPIEAGSELALIKVDIHDIADIAVVDLFVVIVLDLHHLVAGREGPAESLDLTFVGRIQGRLQFDIQGARTNAAPVHGTQHLDILDGVQAEAARNPGSYQLDNAGNGGFGT